jgi:hypothetical protein
VNGEEDAPPPGLAAWIDLVRGLDPYVDDIDIADTFWLARSLPVGTAPVTEAPVVEHAVAATPPVPPLPPASAPPPVATPSTIVGERRVEERTFDLFTKNTVTASGKRVVLRDVAALDGKLALGRALRPLRRRVNSATRRTIDEAATAHRVATLRLAWRDAPLIPTFRPARSRWLDVILLVDRSQSMAFRRRVAEEWELLLHRLGAFGNVRVWHLLPGRDGGEPELSSPSAGGASTPWVRRTTAELSDARGRRLVMLLSDCLGPLWRSPATGQWLARQASLGPLAILQVLPPHLWRRTMLGQLEAVTLRSRTAGAPSSRLLVTARDDEGDDEESAAPNAPASPAIPVFPLEAGPVSAWALMTVGHPLGSAGGYRFELRATAPSKGDDVVKKTPPAEPADRFLRGSSACARKLAAYLAAVPLTASVVRLVREALVPEANEEHVSEVIFSDLVVQRVDDVWKAAPDDEVYDFRPGVREQLLQALGVSQIESVARRIGAFLAERSGPGFDYSVILDERAEGPRGETAGAPRPFASVQSALFAATRSRRKREPRVDERFVAAREMSARVPAEAAVAAKAPALAIENGFWVLVDGDDHYVLPPAILATAKRLGTALARAGFSLVTFGVKGVAHVVARAFWDELARAGYSSGIYRMVNVVDPGQKSDFGRGRTMFPEKGGRRSRADFAVERADHVVSLGHSRFSDDVIRAANTRKLGTVDMTTTDVETTVALFLRADLGIDQKPDVSWIRALLDHAGQALDEPSLEEYNRRLRRLEASPFQKLSLPITQLLLDARRPSHRLLGHLANRKPTSRETLIAVLRAERKTVSMFWETRPLWFALEEIDSIQDESPLDYALAAMCCTLERDLEAAPQGDRGGQCRTLLRGARQRLKTWARAETLAKLAVHYEELPDHNTQGAESGPAIRIVNNVARRALASRGTDAEMWFESGYPGHRIVALALSRTSRPIGDGRIVIEAIERPLSRFERFLAVTVAERQALQMDRQSHAEFLAGALPALERCRSEAAGRDSELESLAENVITLIGRDRRPLVPKIPPSTKSPEDGGALADLIGAPRQATPEELLREMEVPGYPGVFVVGETGHNTQEVSQQTRALNLVYALLSRGVLGRGKQVAVFGAGMSGLAAATGAAFHGCRVALIEQEAGPLSRLKQNHTRWIDPHADRWPEPGWDASSAGVPLLEWQADRADGVAGQVLRRFRALPAIAGQVTEYYDAPAHRSFIDRGERPLVRWAGYKNEFDAVILALGQGRERTLGNLPLARYWDDDSIEKSPERPKNRPLRYLVSGNGYAGITDLLRICLARSRYADLGSVIESFPGMAKLSRELRRVERVRDPAQYSDAITSLQVPRTIDEWLTDLVRGDTEVVVTGMDQYPITRGVPLLGQLLFARLLALQAVSYIPSLLKSVRVFEWQDIPWEVVLSSPNSGADKTHQFDHVLIRWGCESYLERNFDYIARARNNLPPSRDLARFPSWPLGAFSPEPSSSAPPVP